MLFVGSTWAVELPTLSADGTFRVPEARSSLGRISATTWRPGEVCRPPVITMFHKEVVMLVGIVTVGIVDSCVERQVYNLEG